MKIFSELDLTAFNSYRIKSKCRIAYFPESESDVCELFSSLKEYVLIGSGHNIILSKEYYQVPFVIFNGNFDNFRLIENCSIEVEAGAMMWDVSEFACNNSLSGLEIFWDIPSSLGGAVVMNAGASGEEIKDVLVKVRYYDLRENQIFELKQEHGEFSYRNSYFQQFKDKIVLKAWLKLEEADPMEIRRKMELIKEQRWAKQPTDLPNAGSVFKRPHGYYVGTIIDELGLKGYQIGGFRISEKHGGFIVNVNNGTGSEVLELIAFIQEKVRNKFGVNLEIEQRII
jgi:UDP-N-acetylmuramate dehydrogenase